MLVLATVLLGIALGSALVSPLVGPVLARVPVYAILQAGIGSLALLGTVAFARIFGIMDLLGSFDGLATLVESELGWMLVAALVAMLWPMILLGASFPIAATLVASDSGRAGHDVGVLYAGNTAGAILGALAAGFLLVPLLGTQRSIYLLAGLNAVIATGQRRATGAHECTFIDAFPYATMWANGTLLIGSNRPFDVSI